MVLIDPEYLKDRKVYAHVLAAFRYGREDLDVLGLTFRKDLFLVSYAENITRFLLHLQFRSFRCNILSFLPNFDFIVPAALAKGTDGIVH